MPGKQVIGYFFVGYEEGLRYEQLTHYPDDPEKLDEVLTQATATGEPQALVTRVILKVSNHVVQACLLHEFHGITSLNTNQHKRKK